jgi:hypothetical protein
MAACECSNFCESFMMDAAVCVEQGGQWVRMNQNFDHVGWGILSLVEISTTEGWVDVMYAAVDSTGPMRNPRRDAQIGFSIVFVLFIFLGSFFLLNLCVGVIVDNFTQMKQEQGGALMETPSQARWVAGKRALSTRQTLFGVTNLQNLPFQRRVLFLIVHDSKFETFIMVCIVLNTCVMGVKAAPPLSFMGDTTTLIINYVFAGIFFVEAAMKLYVLRWAYFRDGWNKFDFVCVLATLFGILLDEVFKVPLGAATNAIRLFRIARLFRLLRFAKGLNQIFVALILTIPKLCNVGVILIILLGLFSVMGMHVFGKTHALGPHDAHANFRTLMRSVLTLFRCMTGEGWNELMHSLAKDSHYFGVVMGEPCVDDFQITADNFASLEERCLIENPVGCGQAGMSFTYFVVYTCTITFVILNLFVAVVLEGFDGSAVGEEEAIVHKCIDVWMRFDKNVELSLPVHVVQDFIETVETEYSANRNWKPLPKQQKVMVREARSFVFEWLHCSNSQVSFLNATLGALMIVLCEVAVNEPWTHAGKGSSVSVDEIQKVIEEIREISVQEREEGDRVGQKEKSSELSLEPNDSGKNFTVSVDNFKEHSAAMHVQRKFKELQRRRTSNAENTVRAVNADEAGDDKAEDENMSPSSPAPPQPQPAG